MSLARSTLVKGPAKCIYTPAAGAATFFSKSDFSIKLAQDTFDLSTSAHGIEDTRKLNRYVRASIVPDGRWNADLIAALWPHSGTFITPGTSIYDSSADRTLAIHASDGALHTIISAGVRQMPDLLFSAKDTLVGAVEFGGVLGTDKDWDDPSGLHTIATGATFTDSAWLSSNLIKTQPYTLSVVGLTGFSALESLDGWRVSFPRKLTSWEPDSLGLMDESVEDEAIVITGTPINLTAAQIQTALRTNNTANERRGLSFSAGAGQLTIVGLDGVTYLTVPSANVTSGDFGFGRAILRNGEIAFVGLRTFGSGGSAGVPQPLFTLAAA